MAEVHILLLLLNPLNISTLTNGQPSCMCGGWVELFLVIVYGVAACIHMCRLYRMSFIIHQRNRALWSSYLQCPMHSRGLTGLPQMLPCELLLVTLDCSPASCAKTLPGGKSVRSYLAELRLVVQHLKVGSVRYVIIETDANVT